MIRPYRREDQYQVLDLFRFNTPQYFHPFEENDFIKYLETFADNYFVFEEQGNIVGCGGYNFSDDKSMARISWDIIHPDFHGKGIGSKLTRYRIDKIKETSSVRFIVVRTTQLTFRFYEKIGFELEKTEKDFWAPGFDLYQMRIALK